MTNLEHGVRELLEEFIDVPSDAFAPIQLNELTLAEVMQELEERFGVQAKDASSEHFRSVSAIVAYVTRHRPAK